jgi:hypothetical protein
MVNNLTSWLPFRFEVNVLPAFIYATGINIVRMRRMISSKARWTAAIFFLVLMGMLEVIQASGAPLF